MNSLPSERTDELDKLEGKHAENPEGRYFVPLANLYRRRGDLDRAMSLLRAGLARHPDYLSARIVLGRCLADRGECDAAETELRYVLSLDSENLVALRTMGELAVAKGEPEEGRNWYRELLGVDPANEEARRALDSLDGPPGVPTQAPRDDDERPAAAEEPIGAAEAIPFDQPILPAEPSPADGEGIPAEEHEELDQPVPSNESTVSTEAPLAAESTGEPPASETAAGDHEDVSSTEVDFEPTAEADELFVGSRDEIQRVLREGREIVVTETIAELYTRQGFYDRAAEVYRELIARRDGDEVLEERLLEVEHLAAGNRLEAGEGEIEDELFAGPAVPESPDLAVVADFSPWTLDHATDEGLEDTDTIPFIYPPPNQSPVVEPSLEPGVEVDTFAESFVAGFPGIELDEASAGAEEEVFALELPPAAEGSIGELNVTEPTLEEVEDVNESSSVPAGAESGNGVWGPVEPAIEEIEIDLAEEEELMTVPISEAAPTDDRQASIASVEEPRSIRSFLIDVLSWTPGAADSRPPEGQHERAGPPESFAGTPSSDPPAGEADLFPWEMPSGGPGHSSAGEVGSFDLADDPAEELESSLEASEVETPGHSDVSSDGSVSRESIPDGTSSETPGVEAADDDLQSFQAWLRSLKR